MLSFMSLVSHTQLYQAHWREGERSGGTLRGREGERERDGERDRERERERGCGREREMGWEEGM